MNIKIPADDVREEENKEEDGWQRKPPKAPDGGWGWVVVASGFCNAFILLGIPVSFGIFFNEKLTRMEISSTTVGWIFNLFNFNFNFASVFTGSLCDVFSWRSVGFTAASIAGIGYVFMIFIQSTGIVFLLFSFIVGWSSGIVSVIGFLVIPHYFDVHRGRASAIIMTGVSMGQIVLPLLLRFLLDEYGFPGACLIFGGLLFNCAALNLFHYPAQKRPLIKGDAMLKEVERKSQTPLMHKRTIANNAHVDKFEKERAEISKTPYGIIREILRISWDRTCQLQHLTLLIVTLSFTFLIIGYVNLTVLLPFAMAAKGHHSAKASYCMSAGAVTNTSARVFVSLASDKKWFSRKLSFIFGSIVAALATFATVFVLHDALWIMVCQIFWGFGIGANLSVYHNLTIDTCGRELYDAGTAVTGLLIAILSLAVGPIIGVVRDYTSYEISIAITASFQLMCALFWIFMPLARKYDSVKFQSQLSKEKELETTQVEHPRIKTLRSKSIDVSHMKSGLMSSGLLLARTDAGYLKTTSSISLTF
ncbi:Major facilitator superfamily [Trinorchestia longiramus]|nr:Major facilitator superfamily [Trinorchestia longiramus]